MKISPVPIAPILALLLTLFSQSPASANSQTSLATPSPTGPSFDSLRLGLSANPPAQCTAPLYGTIAARSPDGALCLCHQGYTGKQAFWEQIGTAQPCWPDKK